MTASEIDLSTMLTLLGLVAAVWTVIPASAKLNFRLSLTAFDWLIIWGGIGLLHYLLLEDVLASLGLFASFGPWKWGFTKSLVVYLLCLGLSVYIYVRSRKPRLNRRKLPMFSELLTSLMHARKYEELTTLLATYLSATFKIANPDDWRASLERRLRPPVNLLPSLIYIEEGRFIQRPIEVATWYETAWRSTRTKLANLVSHSAEHQAKAISALKVVLSFRDTASYLATAHPYLCLDVMERAQNVVEDFQDEVFTALLASEGSVFYLELKNSQGLAGVGSRYHIPDENRLLSFYLRDAHVARRLGVYRSLGEAILARIDTDDVLLAKLNGSLFTYQDTSKYRCPIYCGIHFFRIMVLEGLHQRVADHLWLHYVTHFCDRLLERARPYRPDDENSEFPSPLMYLVSELVYVTRDWIREATRLPHADGTPVTLGQDVGEHVHIAFEAAEALGGLMRSVVNSEKISRRAKLELLEAIARLVHTVEGHAHLADLATTLISNIVRPHGFRWKDGYIQSLQALYQEIDHPLRGRSQALVSALREELANR